MPPFPEGRTELFVESLESFIQSLPLSSQDKRSILRSALEAKGIKIPNRRVANPKDPARLRWEEAKASLRSGPVELQASPDTGIALAWSPPTPFQSTCCSKCRQPLNYLKDGNKLCHCDEQVEVEGFLARKNEALAILDRELGLLTLELNARDMGGIK